MDRTSAIQHIDRRCADLAHWGGLTPFSQASGLVEGASQELVTAAVEWLRTIGVPYGLRSDFHSWKTGGFKRNQLDEAITAVGLKTWQDTEQPQQPTG